MGANLCPYPSMEAGETGWEGWHHYYNSVLEAVSSLGSPIETGVTTGARYTPTGSGPGQHAILTSPFIPVTPGEAYVYSFYVCGLPVNGEYFPVQDSFLVQYWDAAKSNSIVSAQCGDYTPTPSWQRISSPALTPQVGLGIAYARISVYIAFWSGNKLELTSFQAETAPLTDYNDGTTNWTASLIINAGAASTDDNDVTLTIACDDQNGDPPDQMRFAEDAADADEGDVVWGAWEAYATTKAWQLAAQTDEAAHARGVGVEFRNT